MFRTTVVLLGLAAALLASGPPAHAAPGVAAPGGTWTVSTVAGNGDEDAYGDGALATRAGLGGPGDVAVAPDGTLYVYADGVIRAVDPRTHRIRTVTGDRRPGYAGDGGPARRARFDRVGGIAVGPDGTLYVADRGNLRVRAIDPRTHRIRTVAGNGDFLIARDVRRSGRATRAPLIPDDVAVGADGDVYVADAWTGIVVRVRPRADRFTLVLAGSHGIPSAVRHAVAHPAIAPTEVAVGSGGVLYVSGPTSDYPSDEPPRLLAVDPGRRTVRRVTAFDDRCASAPGLAVGADGSIVRACGRDGDGREIVLAARQDRPRARATVLAGGGAGALGDGGPAARADLGLALGTPGLGGSPDAAVAADGTVYVTDATHQRVRALRRGHVAAARLPRVPGSGTVVTLAGGHGGDAARTSAWPIAGSTLAGPSGVAVDPEDGTVYVVDDSDVFAVDPVSGHARVLTGGRPVGVLTTPAPGPTSVRDADLYPGEVAAGRGHRLYVTDDDGVVLLDLVHDIAATVPATAGLRFPQDVAVSPDGDLYVVADSRLCVVRPGSSTCRRFGRGDAFGTGLESVDTVAVAPDGTVYVGAEDCVRRLDRRGDRAVPVAGCGTATVMPAATGTLRPGTLGTAYRGDGGPALSAAFVEISGLAVTAGGTLYVTDDRDRRLRAVDLRTGTIATVAGGPAAHAKGDGEPAARVALAEPAAVAIARDGGVLVADQEARRVLAVGSPAPHGYLPHLTAGAALVVIALGVVLYVRRRRRTTSRGPATAQRDGNPAAPA